MEKVPSGDQLTEIVNENTILKLTPKWVRNIVANEEAIKKGKGCKEFFVKEGEKRTRDVPAVIVSGGPSLDKNIKHLPKAKNKAVILVVDSMLKKVMEVGVKPDFVITTDAEWGEWGNCFNDLPMSTKDIPLIAEVYVNKKAIESWEGPIYWYAVAPMDGSPLSKILEPEFTGHTIGRIACGGCVSSIAFAFASGGLKCDPIIMIGQDCGYYDDERHHASGFEYDENLEYAEVVEDIYGRPMFTTPVLKAYAYWFERIVSGRVVPGFSSADGTFINATQGGMVSRGWLIQTFEQAIRRYLTKEYNIHDLLFPKRGGKNGRVNKTNKKIQKDTPRKGSSSL